MGISAQQVGTTLIVRLEGELDVHSSGPFRELVTEAFKNNPRLKHLVISMEHVTFIDSAGIGAILGRYKEVTEAGGRMTVAGVQQQVRRLLSMSGVLRLITAYDSEGQALTGR